MIVSAKTKQVRISPHSKDSLWQTFDYCKLIKSNKMDH